MSVWELPGKERDAPIGAFYGDRPASGMAQNMICRKYYLRQERDLPDGLRRMDPLVHRAPCREIDIQVPVFLGRDIFYGL